MEKLEALIEQIQADIGMFVLLSILLLSMFWLLWLISRPKKRRVEQSLVVPPRTVSPLPISEQDESSRPIPPKSTGYLKMLFYLVIYLAVSSVIITVLQSVAESLFKPWTLLMVAIWLGVLTYQVVRLLEKIERRVYYLWEKTGMSWDDYEYPPDL